MPSISRLSCWHTALRVCSLLTLMSCIQQAHASSPDAWEEFRQSVETACIKASSGVIEVKRIQVDPYGSESYGFAILSGTEAGSPAERLVACAYDKTSEAAEISSPFAP